ncbi:hypothetical protein HFO33_28610 [Rhizobium leguminosarum]|uniref:hypothetical protein n=1 Tax=Rhizobium leguminosarum TaxID=384 RepID=UPI001C960879|nr:hypothetical protein [Rhizobium leguminosarum]MBY5720507.1 hypothetical protein [Rhizobium leguminosarum]
MSDAKATSIDNPIATEQPSRHVPSGAKVDRAVRLRNAGLFLIAGTIAGIALATVFVTSDSETLAYSSVFLIYPVCLVGAFALVDGLSLRLLRIAFVAIGAHIIFVGAIYAVSFSGLYPWIPWPMPDPMLLAMISLPPALLFGMRFVTPDFRRADVVWKVAIVAAAVIVVGHIVHEIAYKVSGNSGTFNGFYEESIQITTMYALSSAVIGYLLRRYPMSSGPWSSSASSTPLADL